MGHITEIEYSQLQPHKPGRTYVFGGFLCLDHSKYLRDCLLFILKFQLKIHL